MLPPEPEKPRGTLVDETGLHVAWQTDQGRVRGNNEDAFWVGTWPEGTLLAVCDGMGGHASGEVASGIAVETLAGAFVDLAPDQDPRMVLYDSLLRASDRIVEVGGGGHRGMGTTAVCGWVTGGEVWVALVGDSRLFHVRAGEVRWRTMDHTRVQGLVERGILTAAEARRHPDAGMLTRALGHPRTSNGDPLEPEVMADAIPLEPGDALVLCSDGLHDLVEDEEIAEAVAGRSPEEAVERLVQLALDRGGHDNVTVVCAVQGPTASTRDARRRGDITETADITFFEDAMDALGEGRGKGTPRGAVWRRTDGATSRAERPTGRPDVSPGVATSAPSGASSVHQMVRPSLALSVALIALATLIATFLWSLAH